LFIEFDKGERRMERKFRALRTLAALYKVLAWVLLIGGILLATLVILFGILASVNGTSPLFNGFPLLGEIDGIVEALALAGLILLYALIQFVVLYAVSEAIYVILAIEQNTRETAYYLRGEAMSNSPSGGYWQGQGE
jgi:hypothetical protein